MRRKLGIIFLIAVTVLAGTQEAARQFEGLKSSMSELTRAGLWSGLMVYAQPVSDGKLPSPQIYYLVPQPQTVPDARGALLVDNRPNDNNSSTTTPKPEAKNNHAAEEAALNMEVAMAAALREVEDAAQSELVLDKLPLNVIASHLAPPPPPPASPAPAPKPAKRRVSEEVARNESFARKFNKHADVIAGVFAREFDAAKLEAELTRLAAAQEQLETSHLKSSVEPEKDSPRRMEFKIMRRAPRPEHIERIKAMQPRFAEKRVMILPELSSIGCEKAAAEAKGVAEATLAAPAAVVVVAAAPSETTEVKVAVEAIVVEVAAPAAAISIPTGTSWALGCDSEPEQK